MKLDIYVQNRHVGILDQVDVSNYVFSYLPGTPSEFAVSLGMPVRTESWSHRVLHPIFQISLPEGSLKESIKRKYAKHVKHFGDTELLAIVGSHLVGRVKAVPAGTSPQLDAPSKSLQALLIDSPQELIDHFVGEHLQSSGVSGGFPKVLSRSPVDTDGSRSTLTFDHWILKLNDEDHPDLVLNEYFGLTLAKKMQLPVPEFHLSNDAQRIAIKRFDINNDGLQMGFEDVCALGGLGASEKFSGSLERVIKTISSYCSPLNVRNSLEQLYAQYLACMAIRNGDAHLKNFGLIYSNFSDARLSPAYDMLSMSAYAPHAQNGDALDAPALSLGGVHRWFSEKNVDQFAILCRVNAAKKTIIKDKLCLALEDTAREILEMTHSRPSFQPMAKRMLELWSFGAKIHDIQVSEKIGMMAEAIPIPKIEDSEPIFLRSIPRQR